MHAVEQTQRSEVRKLHALWDVVTRHRGSIGWLLSAVVILVGTFACTTIHVRDSVFDVFQLRLLVSLMTSVAASHILMAFKVREERWHMLTWATVIAGWAVVFIVT